MAKKEETNLQNLIRIMASKYGICLRHQSGLFYTEYGTAIKIGVPGISDLQLIGYKFIIWFEVKTLKGKKRIEQENFINVMRKLGHRAEFVRSVEEAEKIILEELDKRKLI